jgi:hypothetical protein
MGINVERVDFYAGDTPIFSLHKDGRLELAEGYTPDEAAKAFWSRFAIYFHADSKRKWWEKPL